MPLISVTGYKGPKAPGGVIAQFQKTMQKLARDPASEAYVPPIGITMGCPVGVGPEIILKLLTDPAWQPGFRPVVIGDSGVLARAGMELGIPAEIVPWLPGRQGQVPVQPGRIEVFEAARLDRQQLIWGKPGRETGQAAAAYITEAVRLLLRHELSAMVTCPIAKAVLRLAGFDYPGHTEMLASLCGSSDYAMMMAGPRLRVTLVTIHQPLSSVPAGIRQAPVLRLIRLTAHSLQVDFGLPSPRLAVAGLNPHSGEAGLFGDEEQREIAPAVLAARSEGLNVTGPLAPDTVFHRAVAGEFDAVVCMYHDQGLIPFKLIHFTNGVNVTMGLPIVRTSVDHGTAYDIAGKGIASPESLRAACELAWRIAGNRRKAETVDCEQ